MKRIVAVILNCVVTTGFLLAQAWNSTVTTTISPSLGSMSVFSNKDGVHVVYNNGSGTKYALLNSSGSVVRSSTISTSTSTGYPKITGDNSKVYLLYSDGQNIKTWLSTDAGANWTSITDVSMGTSNTNGIDATFDPSRGLYLVYSASNGMYYTYYKLYDGS